MNEAMVFYKSFYEAIKWLDEAEQLKCYRAIMEYSLNGIEPDIEGPSRAVFECCKAQIDANERRREAGRKGGEAKASKSKQESGKDVANSSEPLANSSKPLANPSKDVAEAKQTVAKEKEK